MFAANPSRPGATFFLIFVKDQSCDLRYYRISSPAEKSQLKRAAKWRPSLFRPNQDLSNRSGKPRNIHRNPPCLVLCEQRGCRCLAGLVIDLSQGRLRRFCFELLREIHLHVCRIGDADAFQGITDFHRPKSHHRQRTERQS
jgi:hypothetical protein